MVRWRWLFPLAFLLALLAACGPAATPTPPPAPSGTPEPPLEESYPLGVRGAYFVGRRTVTVPDPSREGRSVEIRIVYPALKPEGFTGSVAPDADADRSGAPYPLLLTTSNSIGLFSDHLASHGFAVAGVTGLPKTRERVWGNYLIDEPLDMLFALDYLAGTAPEGLAGAYDAEAVGVLGYSSDALNTLFVGGARVDPAAYLAKCASAGEAEPPFPEWWIRYICTPSYDWEAFAAHAGAGITESGDGLWQGLGRERIKALAPMGSEGAWLFGERGLAAVTAPVLSIAGDADTTNPYVEEQVFIFEHLGSAEKVLITFRGEEHMMVGSTYKAGKVLHFVVAFFGYHLQGKAEYAELFSQPFVEAHPELGWGVVR